MAESHSKSIEKIREQFKFLCKDPRVLGIVLYGSFATGEHHVESDIDICIVTTGQEFYPIYKTYAAGISGNIDKFDIRFFEELPLLIRGDVIEEGIILCTRDMGELTEYFFFSTRKDLADHRYRLKYV